MSLGAFFKLLLASPEVLKIGGSLAKAVLSGDKGKAFVGQLLTSITNLARIIGRFVAIYEIAQSKLPDTEETKMVKASLAILYDDTMRELSGMKDLCLEFKNDSGVDPAMIDRVFEQARDRLLKLGEPEEEKEKPPQQVAPTEAAQFGAGTG